MWNVSNRRCYHKRNVIEMKRFYYGWVMLSLGFIGVMLCAIPVYSFGIFIKPLTTEFDWERGALSLAVSMFSLLFGLSNVVVTGRLSDKYGPRFLVTAGGLLIAIGFYLMSRVDSLWQVYLIWGFLIGVGGSGV